jgi:hypothetical protein
VTCPPGNNGAGGNCRCTESIFWDQGQWEVGCSEGACYVRQPYGQCNGKVKKHSLGDGTFCFEAKRFAMCPMHNGKFS